MVTTNTHRSLTLPPVLSCPVTPLTFVSCVRRTRRSDHPERFTQKNNLRVSVRDLLLVSLTVKVVDVNLRSSKVESRGTSFPTLTSSLVCPGLRQKGR